MQKEAFKNVVATRASLASIVLVTNAFVWYFYAFTILKDIADGMALDQSTILLTWSIHAVGAISFALIGALWIRKRNKRTVFLISWMLLGAISSLALLIGNSVDISSLLIFAFLFGMSFGIGMPTCMGYFAEYTSVENRGRLGGLIMFINGIGMFSLGIVAVGNIAVESVVLTSWRLIGLVIFLIIRPHEESKDRKIVSYRFALAQRPFILYLIPWLLFSLVNYLSLPVLSNILKPEMVNLSMAIENVFVGVFAIVGGFLSDFLGRKRMALTGFVLLGIGYTILGIAPTEMLSLYFYTIVDGIALGILYAMFVVTVWGDLSYGATSDKYYAISGIPFFVSMFLRSAIGTYVSEVSPYAIFSFTAFFLFLAVLPLMYAPETLPEKTIRERELKGYIEKAKKAKEKYS